MILPLHYGHQELTLDLPDNTIVYESAYTDPRQEAAALLLASLNQPVGSEPLTRLVEKRKPGKVVIVVSDITRPIPYASFLPELIASLESAGVKKEEIMLLVATGMHRASTPAEHLRMFGEFVVKNYLIVDHDCGREEELQEVAGTSWSGSRVRLNKHYVEAGFRIVTGLVEPHFMAGFSGGRKAICPGLVALDSVQKFHGYQFLSHPRAASTLLTDNPCHEENSSIARLCPPDFSINVVLNQHKQVNAIISGELFASHRKTVEYVEKACCPVVTEPADLVVTSSGGYPLDATFYQCVKGFVNCLPAVREGGEIIAFGSCLEGIGSPEYSGILKKYAADYHPFLEEIKSGRSFVKDQWQFQMHIRTLERVGRQNLHFYTSNLAQEELAQLSVQPHTVAAPEMEAAVQSHIDKAVAAGKQIAIFPEGPYCSPKS